MIIDIFAPDFEQVIREIEEARRQWVEEQRKFLEKALAEIRSDIEEEEPEPPETKTSILTPPKKAISEFVLETGHAIPWYTSGFT